MLACPRGPAVAGAAPLRVAGRIGDPRGEKALRTQVAGIAMTARVSLRVGAIAAHRLAEVHSQACALACDIGLAHAHQRRMDAQARAFHARLRGHIGQSLERFDEGRSAIGIAGIVDRVDPAVDVARAQDLGPAQSKA